MYTHTYCQKAAKRLTEAWKLLKGDEAAYVHWSKAITLSSCPLSITVEISGAAILSSRPTAAMIPDTWRQAVITLSRLTAGNDVMVLDLKTPGSGISLADGTAEDDVLSVAFDVEKLWSCSQKHYCKPTVELNFCKSYRRLFTDQYLFQQYLNITLVPIAAWLHCTPEKSSVLHLYQYQVAVGSHWSFVASLVKIQLEWKGCPGKTLQGAHRVELLLHNCSMVRLQNLHFYLGMTAYFSASLRSLARLETVKVRCARWAATKCGLFKTHAPVNIWGLAPYKPLTKGILCSWTVFKNTRYIYPADIMSSFCLVIKSWGLMNCSSDVLSLF